MAAPMHGGATLGDETRAKLCRHSTPAHWRVELCNRNAGKGGYRVDWVGFDHCIRNAALRPSARALRTTKR